MSALGAPYFCSSQTYSFHAAAHPGTSLAEMVFLPALVALAVLTYALAAAHFYTQDYYDIMF